MGILRFVCSVFLCDHKAFGNRGIDEDGHAIEWQDSNAGMIVLLGRCLFERVRRVLFRFAYLEYSGGFAIAALGLARDGFAICFEGSDEVE